MKNHLLRVFVAVVLLSALTLLLGRWKLASDKPRRETAIPDGKAINSPSGKPAVEKTVEARDGATKGGLFPSLAPPPAPPKKPEAKK